MLAVQVLIVATFASIGWHLGLDIYDSVYDHFLGDDDDNIPRFS